jgi:hypothetical protein
MTKDLTKKFKINGLDVYFDYKDWTWVAVNSFGFGVDSDMSLTKLKKRIKTI